MRGAVRPTVASLLHSGGDGWCLALIQKTLEASGLLCILLASTCHTVRELLLQRLSSKPGSWGHSKRPGSSVLELPAHSQEGRDVIAQLAQAHCHLKVAT